MIIKTIDEISMTGIFVLIYSKQGIGKTVNTLLTAPLPIRYYDPENRSLAATLKVVLPLRPELKEEGNFIQIEHETFNDTMAMLSSFDKTGGTFFTDSLTALMNMELLTELQEQDYAGRTSEVQTDKQKAKDIVSQTKTSQEMYGALGSGMLRVTNALKKISKKGVVVIASALEEYEPDWCPDYTYAPAFGGKMYGRNMPGNFDLIGRVVEHKHIKSNKCRWCGQEVEKTETIYPPIIRFKSKGKISWLDKWTGKGIRTDWPLNWEKILK